MVRQKGNNPKYPKEIEYWKFGQSVPEWLSDNAKVKFIDGEGNITLDFKETNTGLDLPDSSGKSILLRLTGKDDYICMGDNIIFSLTKKQFKILFGL